MRSADVVVRPITHADVASLRACVNAVVRERKYLAFLEPFSIDQMTSFVAGNIERGNPHFVAVDTGRVVGWCDVRREAAQSYAHVGHLGMGLLPEYRGRGIGERLIRAALDASAGANFEKIELSVYAKNTRARALYEKVGFVLEGTRVRGRKVDGVYEDVHVMGWFAQ